MKRLIILGAGTAGTMAAQHLKRELSREWVITVVDENEHHYYQPGFLLYPFGKYTEKDIVKKKSDYIPQGVEFKLHGVERILPDTNHIELRDGSQLNYDILIIATGVKTAPDKTPGLMEGIEKGDNIFNFYTFDGAQRLREALKKFKEGNVVVQVIETPIKCPVAPLEFAFLANEFFCRRGIRDNIHITYITPLDGAFTKPIASKHLGSMLADRTIQLVANFGTESVNTSTREIVGYDGRTIPYDLLVTVPINVGDPVIARSGMGDELNLVPTHKETLQSEKYKNVFVVGDAGNFPTSKAGSVAHFQMKTLVTNIKQYIQGKPLIAGFDGHANCFIESGNGKALLLDFNYDTEPKPGLFPSVIIGPMKLLAESRINHWGKLAFRWMYWNLLMRGRGIPGIRSKMKKRT